MRVTTVLLFSLPLMAAAPARAELLAVYDSEANRAEYHGVYQEPLREWLDARGEAYEVIGDDTAADPDALAKYDVILASSVYIVPDTAAAGLTEYVSRGGGLLWIDSPARCSDSGLREALGLGSGSTYAPLGPTTLTTTPGSGGAISVEGALLASFVGNPATSAADGAEVLCWAEGRADNGKTLRVPAVTQGRAGAGAGICVNWIPWLNTEPEVGQILSDALELLLAGRGLEGPGAYVVATVADRFVEQPAPLRVTVRLHRREPGPRYPIRCAVALKAEGARRASADLGWVGDGGPASIAAGTVDVPTAGVPDGDYTIEVTVRCGEVEVVCRPAKVTLEGEAGARLRQQQHERRLLLEPTLEGTLGDYDLEPRTPEGLVDIPKLMDEIRGAHMTMYDWLIWHAPTDLDDLKRFLPAAKGAGIRVWVTLCPPSESGGGMPYSEPHRTDYHAWAHEIGRLAQQYDNLVALVIDDFRSSGNDELFTPEYIAELSRILRSHTDRLAFLPTIYIDTVGDKQFIRDYRPYIDGIVFPYGKLDDAAPLRDELARCREWIGPGLFLMVNVYASGSDGRTEQGPRSEEYIREALTISHDAADGIRVYCLPKADGLADYRYAITAELYAEWGK